MIPTRKTQTATRLATLALACAAIFGATLNARAQQETRKTTLRVDVAFERTELIAGPYARYSQKYLGVVAPLADKVTHSVTSVAILETDGASRVAEPAAAREKSLSHMSPERGFPRLTLDKSSAIAEGAEESARLAAQKIFDIRRSRFDLITGNVGENVFGGGLAAAIDELSRLEEEYLSLFFGKQTSRTGMDSYRVTPDADRLTYTVCRFSEAAGLLAPDDLSGEPLVLDLKDTAPAPAAPAAKPNSRAVAVTLPAMMECRAVLGGAVLDYELIEIAQLGRTIYVAQ